MLLDPLADPCIFVWSKIPLLILSLPSLTCGAHTSASPSTSPPPRCCPAHERERRRWRRDAAAVRIHRAWPDAAAAPLFCRRCREAVADGEAPPEELARILRAGLRHPCTGLRRPRARAPPPRPGRRRGPRHGRRRGPPSRHSLRASRLRLAMAAAPPESSRDASPLLRFP